MISTFHSDTMTDKRRRTRSAPSGLEIIRKPVMVDSYNQYMGGVDKADQLILYYGFPHHSTKWWKRVFFHMIDLAIVNANILYNQVSPKPLNQLDFRIEIASGLLHGHISPPLDRRHIAPTRELPLRLTERPFPEPVPKETPYGGRPQCEVCRSKNIKRSQTQYRCNLCKTPLHVHPCFQIYHTKLNYSQ